jgi:predicted HicB family RNase H-like nuclease
MAYEIPWGVRMEEELLARLKAEARRSDRSINREIVHRLRRSLEAQDSTAQEATA